MKLAFFPKPEDFRKWLEKNHAIKSELHVGFYKKSTGKPSITWPESVDQALCFGWIDGVRKSVDEYSYSIRFTPRKEKSHWSSVNLKKYKELKKKGLIHPSGEKAFSRMDSKNSARASFEQKKIKLDKKFETILKANKKAWAFFKKMAPYYQHAATWWVISAKKDETKLKRLTTLISSSEAGEKIPPLNFQKKK